MSEGVERAALKGAAKEGEHVIAESVAKAGVRDAEEGLVKAGERAGEKAGEKAGERAAAEGTEKAAEREIGGHSVEDLEKAAQEPAKKGGVEQGGRAAQKHGDREGSVFPKAGNTPAERNASGRATVREILHDPNRRTEVLDRVINVWDSQGRGLRFTRDGKFMGFLEPVK